MPNPRIIRALELIYDTRLRIELLQESDHTRDYWILTYQLNAAENELLYCAVPR